MFNSRIAFKLAFALTVFLSLTRTATAATPSFRFFTDAHPVGSATTIALTLSSAVNSGDLILCFTSYGSASQVLSTMADSVNGAYTQIATGSPVSGNSSSQYVHYFLNSSAGTPTITFTTDGTSVGSRFMTCVVYENVLALGFNVSAGQAQTNPGTGADAVSSGATAATAEANEMAICGSTLNNGSPTLTVGTILTWVQRDNDAGSGSVMGVSEVVIPASATVTCTWTTNSASADSLTQVAVFKGTASGGGAARNCLLMGVC